MELTGWKKWAVYALVAVVGGLALGVNFDARRRKEELLRYDECMKGKNATAEACKKAAAH